ncbi:SRPBCC domain-containing protein [Corallococcus praedator]|uniref:SRPBCC domain-containing protein n=1 Tax=Corallococcus praedator TaxID=2316724 RepID=A0ABX9QD05_9BACT|nr:MULTISPECIES: SRPBCC domain-containing protein [Corallococcus]RKH10084.1 SRPBCC domain-containing protein [Corallococcus sp. CA047B]RKH25103.1 SRPBCC domain-containing protein [Corallococcus sp. CA031C]RKI02584.1 SRPBCC domain-containing protein [Corallococcus praedator]
MTANATKRITFERTYTAPLEDVWELWTTKDGIESWWGPEGFSVTVHELDLRAGGLMRYAMTATAPDQVAGMKQAGLPLTSEARLTYSEVTPQRRLGYTTVVDFIQGVAPYDVSTLVELHPNGQAVRMVVTSDAMHSEEWTKRASQGLESQLGKLSKRFQR